MLLTSHSTDRIKVVFGARQLCFDHPFSLGRGVAGNGALAPLRAPACTQPVCSSLPGRRAWKGAWRWFSESLLDCCLPLEVVKEHGTTISQVMGEGKRRSMGSALLFGVPLLL